MKISIILSFLNLFVTFAWIETNTVAGLRKHHTKPFPRLVSADDKRLNIADYGKRIRKLFNPGENKEDLGREKDVRNSKADHYNSHLQTINGNKRIPCDGTSCFLNGKYNANRVTASRIELNRHRRTGSVFLAKALNLLDHSKPRELWNFATRGTANKPYKQFSNGTDTSNTSSNSTTNLVNKPVKNQQGKKRYQWAYDENEMRPRFFFNSAPAEYVEQKPPAGKPDDGPIHLRQGPLHVHNHLHGMGPGPFLHGLDNHLHMADHPGHLPPMPINFFGHPPPHNIPTSLNFHGHSSHVHHFAPPPPYAIHIDAPPRIDHSPQPDAMSQPLTPINVPPSMSPDMLDEQIPPINTPLGGQPPLPNVQVMPPPDALPSLPIHDHSPIDAPVVPGGVPPDFSVMPPPDVPVSPHAIDIQGMPPPGEVPPMPLMPPPPAVEKVPFPVPIPSPPSVEHVPYPIPVPGPPSIQPVMVPVRVPSPPKIQEVPVPVPSPPKIKNVPVPVPVAVPSPPQVQRVPFPVPVPVKGPPEIQKVFYPIAVPQPSKVRHVPYPVYVRYPPEIRTVPYAVPSPPKPFPVPVPSPPRLMIHRVPYPVIYPQKVPIPIPVVENHHHTHQEAINGAESIMNGQCIVNLCLNGGTCSAYMNTYRCHCPDGFQGRHCEEQNMCRPNPCSNFGVCSQVEHDYECTCSKGFIGKNCDKPDPCIPSPCENGGTCSSDGDSYSCTCRLGWMGKNCQVESKCLPLNPCQNGGTCTETQGTYKCECSPGWGGLSCEVSAPETLHQPVFCDNCQTSDLHLLSEMKRNKLRNRPTNSKKGGIIEGYKHKTST